MRGSFLNNITTDYFDLSPFKEGGQTGGWREHHGVHYIVGLAKNARLHAMLQPLMARAEAEHQRTMKDFGEKIFECETPKWMDDEYNRDCEQVQGPYSCQTGDAETGEFHGSNNLRVYIGQDETEKNKEEGNR